MLRTHLSIAVLLATATGLPRDRDVVLYCSCPDEAAGARAALRLKRRGITRVRPLAGGFPAWRAKGYALASSSAVL